MPISYLRFKIFCAQASGRVLPVKADLTTKPLEVRPLRHLERVQYAWGFIPNPPNLCADRYPGTLENFVKSLYTDGAPPTIKCSFEGIPQLFTDFRATANENTLKSPEDMPPAVLHKHLKGEWEKVSDAFQGKDKAKARLITKEINKIILLATVEEYNRLAASKNPRDLFHAEITLSEIESATQCDPRIRKNLDERLEKFTPLVPLPLKLNETRTFPSYDPVRIHPDIWLCNFRDLPEHIQENLKRQGIGVAGYPYLLFSTQRSSDNFVLVGNEPTFIVDVIDRLPTRYSTTALVELKVSASVSKYTLERDYTTLDKQQKFNRHLEDMKELQKKASQGRTSGLSDRDKKLCTIGIQDEGYWLLGQLESAFENKTIREEKRGEIEDAIVVSNFGFNNHQVAQGEFIQLESGGNIARLGKSLWIDYESRDRDRDFVVKDTKRKQLSFPPVVHRFAYIKDGTLYYIDKNTDTVQSETLNDVPPTLNNTIISTHKGELYLYKPEEEINADISIDNLREKHEEFKAKMRE